MPRDFNRSDRVADAIQRSLAKIIRDEMRDPRLGLININSVQLTRDLSNAKIYITVVGANSENECEEAAKVLNNAASYMRSLVSKELTTRSTPNLKFFYDRSAVHGQELSHLIDKAIKSDESKRVVAKDGKAKDSK